MMPIRCAIACLLMLSLGFSGTAEAEKDQKLLRSEFIQFVAELDAAQKAALNIERVSDGPQWATCGFGVYTSGDKVSSYGFSVIRGDINNDGREEYTVVARCMGAAQSDKIIASYTRQGAGWRDVGFEAALKASKLDASKLPSLLADPFLKESSGKILMQFRNPGEVWMWGDGSIWRVRKL